MSVPSKPSASVVGRRLRRYLGALIAVGFGVAWWNLVVPPAKAKPAKIATTSPKIATTTVSTPPRVAILPILTVMAVPVTTATVTPRVVHRARPKKQPAVVIDPVPVIEHEPIVDRIDPIDPIGTPKLVPIAIVDPPTVDLPIVDEIPEIITRSS